MTVHIIGGGMAGLAAAVACAARGRPVVVYEASPHLGGRCRSYRHPLLGLLDNGTHAVLANNHAVQAYLRQIGAQDRLRTYGQDGLPFVDLRTGARWRLQVPHALWSTAARPPGTTLCDVLAGLRLVLPGHANAKARLQPSPETQAAIWEPLCVAALNTPLDEADAMLLARVALRMLLPSGLARGLLLPRISLDDTYVNAAETWLAARGVTVRRRALLRDVESTPTRLTRLLFDGTNVELDEADRVVLAVPPWTPILTQIGLDAGALRSAAILNVHFKLGHPQSQPRFIGMIGGASQWLLLRDSIATVTVSAAENWMAHPAADLAAHIWREIAPIVGQDRIPPAYHIVKERRATLRHVPGCHRHRPGPRTRLANVFLAGDWVDSGLPCTLESAVRSGLAVAAICTI